MLAIMSSLRQWSQRRGEGVSVEFPLFCSKETKTYWAFLFHLIFFPFFFQNNVTI